MTLLEPTHVDMVTRRLTAAGAPSNAIADAIAATEQGDPAALFALLDPLQGDPAITTVRTRLQRAIDAAASSPSPVHDLRLSDGCAFVDRDGFRRALDALKSGVGPRVLVVHGTSKSGKSYAGNLIRHLVGTELLAADHAGARPQFVYCNLQQLDDDHEDGATPHTVVDDLWRRLTSTERPNQATHEHGNRNVTNAIDQLVGRLATAEGGLCWLVIDGYNHLGFFDIDGAVHALARALLNSPAARAHARLVLLDYPTTAWIRELGGAMREVVTEMLTDAHFRTFFSNWYGPRAETTVVAALAAYEAERDLLVASRARDGRSVLSCMRLAAEKALVDVPRPTSPAAGAGS